MRAIDQINKAIEGLAAKSTAVGKPDEALKYSQAALNLAHVKLNLIQAEGVLEQQKERSKTTGAGS